MFFNCKYATVALPICAFTSASDPPCSSIMLRFLHLPNLLRQDGSSEMDHFFEYNFYVDTILREILTHAGKRRILLSCFDPNVCVMLQLKQQIYPVFQLGISPEYADTRHADFQSLFWSALSHQLLVSYHLIM
ncbi:unnamed protein product [Schistosoma curassoni]|uniref:Glycerophosphocholine phosphodiesterase n=1 Tax=Schistosoma curassoni TaxID=6186 RepID=A0A183JLA2_9TREM|nr:unnamed protein product [Schistosoma curassoni]